MDIIVITILSSTAIKSILLLPQIGAKLRPKLGPKSYVLIAKFYRKRADVWLKRKAVWDSLKTDMLYLSLNAIICS